MYQYTPAYACITLYWTNPFHHLSTIGVTPEPFTLDCQGGTDTANNIVFDCTSNTDLTTVDLQCFLNDVEQSTCK